jgi:outer membrane murein-binding lipoprotein Lpp
VSAEAKDPMQISERELQQLTGDMDDMHHDLMPAMHERAAEWAELDRELRVGISSISGHVSSRRHFLVGSGAAVLGGLLLAACGNDKKKPPASGATTTAAAGTGKLTGDLAVAAVAAALENLAVGTYQAGIDAATAGSLGAVPPAVATFATTAQKHHEDHAAAWNSVLTGAGKEAVTGVDLTVKADVDQAFAAVKDVGALARLALSLENTAAATYLSGIAVLGDTGAIQVAASIQPVEMQHAAILNFVLGNYPVPDPFAKTALARTPDDKIGAA